MPATLEGYETLADVQEILEDPTEGYGQEIVRVRAEYRDASGAVVAASRLTFRGYAYAVQAALAPAWQDVGVLSGDNAQEVICAGTVDVREGDQLLFNDFTWRVARVKATKMAEVGVLWQVLVKREGR